MWQLLGLAGTLLIQVLGFVFIYGKLTRTVEVHDKDINGLKDTQKQHDREIGDLYGHAGVQRAIGRS